MTITKTLGNISGNSNKNASIMESKSSLYESALITGGVLVVSVASSKVLKDNLGVTVTPKNALKLLVAVAISNMVVDYAKKKNYIDINRFN